MLQNCELASIDPQWKGRNNPSHLHSQDLDLLEALKTAKPSMPYNKILEVINANCVIPSGASTSAICRAVQNRLSGGPWTWKRMSNIKYETFTPENVNYCQDSLSYVSSFSMRQGLPFPVLEKPIMDIPPQIIPVLKLVGIWAPQMSL